MILSARILSQASGVVLLFIGCLIEIYLLCLAKYTIYRVARRWVLLTQGKKSMLSFHFTLWAGVTHLSACKLSTMAGIIVKKNQSSPASFGRKWIVRGWWFFFLKERPPFFFSKMKTHRGSNFYVYISWSASVINFLWTSNSSCSCLISHKV